jgi:uncharacterized protein (DUF488 family)
MLNSHTIYTIGYTAFPIEDFVSTAKQFKIQCIIDVRSSPYSGYYKDYDKETLGLRLGKEKIFYRNYAMEFGARQDSEAFQTKEGFLDFEQFVQSKQFQSGVNKIKDSVKKGFTSVGRLG